MKAIAQPKTRSLGAYAFAVQAALLLLLWAAFYAPLIPPLVREWYEHENFSYGFLIPLISIYLAFEQRDRLKKIAILPDFRGAMLLGVVLAVGVLGDLLGEPFISRISLVVALAGVIWTAAGWVYVRVLAFPLAYLLLMVPPPYVIIKPVAYYLRMFDAIAATGALQAMNVPIYRDSYFLNLPNITLEVADVCSGTASLFAMISLGAIYVYYLPTRTRAKFVMLAGTIIFPLIANLIRIILVGATVYWFGPIMLRAFFHSFTGTFTFLLSLIMLLTVGEFLRRRYPVREEKTFTKNDPSSENENDQQVIGDFARKIVFAPMATAGILLMLALYASLVMGSPPSIESRHDLSELPPQVGRFHAAPELWADPYTDPQADKALSRLYEAPDQGRVEMFVGYRGAQYAAHRLSSPKLVFPNRWEYASMDNVVISSGGERIDAVWLLTKKNTSRRVVLYWYQIGNKFVSSDVRYRLELARRLIFKGRTDGAVIRLATDLNDSESIDQALKRLINFSLQLLPQLRRLLPEA